jgi:serine/threonine protein kinase
MSLESGVRLGPYTISTRLGAGGMGEVYRAVDSRLDRHVAIKILPAELSANSQLQLRFEREARTLSQLNHPHICTIHDVGRENGTSFLVMELLEGETLADRLARGPLPLSEVIRYGSQIAEGLDRAHRSGIIHRDLKPGNIMLTKSGAKLLDFGLAKASTITFNPDGETQQKPLTQEGMILGTFQYMSPEQLEGLEADARSDIFALGAVLYEMVTGHRAFDGKTKTSLIAAIVAAQPPPISRVQPLAPTALEHVISRCLEKAPDDRWQSAHDVAEELKWSSATTVETEKTTRGARWLWPLLALLALVAATSSALYLRALRKPHPVVAFTVLPPRNGSGIGSCALSPDGQAIAFVARDENGEIALWLRRLSAVTPVRLTTRATAIAPSKPFWSPDSRWIGFNDQNSLLKISVDGGKPELIARQTSYGVGASWSRRGTIVYCPRFNEGLFRVAASGGDPVRVTSLDLAKKETLHGWPLFVDDDRFLFMLRMTADDPNQIYAASLDGKLKQKVVNADSLVGLRGDDLLFVRNGSMFAQSFDRKKMAVSGDPRKVIEDVFYEEDNAHSYANVADDGSLIYQPASNALRRVEVAWYDYSGRMVEKLFEGVSIADVLPSPDETRIAMRKWDPKKGAFDIYTRDLTRGVESRLTGGLSNHETVQWAATSDRVVYSSDRKGMYDVYAQSDDSASPAETLLESNEDKHPSHCSRDGQFLLVNRDSAKTRNDIWLVPLNAPQQARPLIATDGSDRGGRFSPDGKWISYWSDVSGRDEEYVRPFPDGRSVQVSVDGGAGGEWTEDGASLVFSTPDRILMTVKLDFNGKEVRPGKPEMLFRLPKGYIWWTLSGRSHRILQVTAVDPAEATAVLNYVSAIPAN